MPHKGYNRNASSLEDEPPAPTYAETLLYARGFKFQSRQHEEKIDLRMVSKVDIERIVNDIDLEVLQSLLENLVYSQISEDDFDLYSNDCFVKLFQINQLTMEYLLDVQETLSANLNGLAKKYAAKKREVESLSKNLARQDAEVATLRDELHYTRELVTKQESTSPAIEKLDPSLFPSQERRDEVETVPGEEISSEEPSSHSNPAAESANDPSTSDAETTKLVRLNVVSSIHGKYSSLDVCGSITMQDLKKMLFEQLPGLVPLSAESLSISFKGKRLVDPEQTLDDVGVDADSNALVLETTPQDATPSDYVSRPATKTPENEAIGSKLEDLVSAVTLAHEELVAASQTIHHHVSLQDKHSEAILAFIGAQLQHLQSLVRDDIERNIRKVVMEHLDKHEPVKQIEADSPKTSLEPSAQLDIGEIESDHEGEGDKDRESINDSENKVQLGSHDTDEHNQSLSVGDLWIDTKEGYSGPLCNKRSSSLHDAISEEFDIPNEVNVDAAELEVDAVADDSCKCVFPLPDAYNLHKETDKSAEEERPPTPDRRETKDSVNHDTIETTVKSPNLSPKLISMPTPPTLKKIHDGLGHFRFSGYESEECVDVDIVNESYHSNNDMSKICGFNPEITLGATNPEDMESVCIEVSQSDFQAVAAAKPEAPEDAAKGKCFGRKRSSGKKSMSLKTIMKWKKLKGKKDSKLYEM